MSKDAAKILIVDDEASNIQVLAAALRGEFEIYFALDGEQALDIATSKDVDLMMLDVVMPKLDGFEVLRVLKSKEETQHIPVIFVTAMTDEENEAKGLNMGAVDYVSKPFRPAVVRARINAQLKIKRQRELLEQHAFIDGLTEIANRRRFEDAIDRRWRSAQRTGGALALALLDIDHFKQYNDHYGHAIGDECLKRVAQRINSCFRRPEDVVARYRGDEFAVLAISDEDEFAQHLQYLIDSLYAMNVPHAHSTVDDRLTLSVGAVRQAASRYASHAHLVEAAEELLQRAKEQGRVRCCYRDDTTHFADILEPARD